MSIPPIPPNPPSSFGYGGRLPEGDKQQIKDFLDTFERFKTHPTKDFARDMVRWMNELIREEFLGMVEKYTNPDEFTSFVKNYESLSLALQCWPSPAGYLIPGLLDSLKGVLDRILALD